MYYIIFAYSIFNLFFIRFFFALPGFSFLLDVKQTVLKLKNPLVYLTLLMVNVKKYFFFLSKKRFFNQFKLIRSFINLLTAKFLLWRPLFKRFSYFGNFKLTNSKFFKN
jgi:hypothetical protein